MRLAIDNCSHKKGVTEVNPCLFKGCQELLEIHLPNGIVNVGSNAFSGCTGIVTAVLPWGVKTIEGMAFYNCAELTSVRIPSSVVGVGDYAFALCKLQTIYVDPGDADRIRGLLTQSGDYWPTMDIVEDGPKVMSDESCIVRDEGNGLFLVKPSEKTKDVVLTIPFGFDAGRVLLEVSPEVQTIEASGARIKIVRGADDITTLLNIPNPDARGVIHMSKAVVKPEFVAEALDLECGAEIKLDSNNPSIKTSNTRVGLRYTFYEGTALNEMKEGDSMIGNGLPWSPFISVRGGRSGFYQINVEK